MYVYEPPEPEPVTTGLREVYRPPKRPRKAIEAAFEEAQPPPKLVDMKLPPRPELEATKAAQLEAPQDRYPYGLKLRFEQDEVDKMPKLTTFRAGDTVSITGIGKVVEISMREEQEGEERWTVEIQIEKVNVVKGG